MATRQPYDRDDFATEPRSVDLHDYWQVMRRRWVTIVVMAVVGALLGAGYVLQAKPSYTATAEVLVSPATQGPLNMPSQPNLLVNMSTEQAVAQSAPVVAGAAKILQVPAEQLQVESTSRLSVAVPVGSDVLQLTWQAGTATAAQAGARAFASAYLAYRHNELSGTISGLEKILRKQVATLQKQITSVSAELSTMPATSASHQSVVVRLGQLTSQLTKANSQLASLPTYDASGGQVIGSPLPPSPSGLGRSVILALGVLLGLILGLVLAFVRDVFDDRIRDAEQMERKLGASVLVQMPTSAGDPAAGDGPAKSRPTASRADASRRIADPRTAEAVRTLRATLAAIAGRGRLRTVLIVAADGSISASRIVAELGAAIAESGRRVLLMAGDVRGSTLAGTFDLPDGGGLTDLIAGESDPVTLTRYPRQFAGFPLPSSFARRLAVITGGSRAPQSVLDSASMMRLLSGQVEAYDFVLLDCPPASVAGDVVALATYVDSVIVLARVGRSKGRVLKDLRRRLERVDAQVIGGVLIGKGRLGRHRNGEPAVKAALQAQADPSADRREEARERPSARPASSDRSDAGADSSAVRRSPPPITRPMPAVPRDGAPRGTGSGTGNGSLAQRPL